MDSTVGTRLRSAREHLGLSQRDVANLLNVSKSTVLHREAGRSVLRADELPRWAQALGVTPHWLAFGDEAPRPPREESTEQEEDGRRGEGRSDRDLLFELAAAVRASARALEARITEVEAPEARALELAQKNIERMMRYMPDPHSVDRRDEEAVRDA